MHFMEMQRPIMGITLCIFPVFDSTTIFNITDFKLIRVIELPTKVVDNSVEKIKISGFTLCIYCS